MYLGGRLFIQVICFIGYLLTCRLDSTSACYKASTKTQNTRHAMYV